jgi:hypothetical protein
MILFKSRQDYLKFIDAVILNAFQDQGLAL